MPRHGHASAARGTWYKTITTQPGIKLATYLWQTMPLMLTADWRNEMIEVLNDMGLKSAGLNESGWKEVEPNNLFVLDSRAVKKGWLYFSKMTLISEAKLYSNKWQDIILLFSIGMFREISYPNSIPEISLSQRPFNFWFTFFF